MRGAGMGKKENTEKENGNSLWCRSRFTSLDHTLMIPRLTPFTDIITLWELTFHLCITTQDHEHKQTKYVTMKVSQTRYTFTINIPNTLYITIKFQKQQTQSEIKNKLKRFNHVPPRSKSNSDCQFRFAKGRKRTEQNKRHVRSAPHQSSYVPPTRIIKKIKKGREEAGERRQEHA